jgi:hypothetical protein
MRSRLVCTLVKIFGNLLEQPTISQVRHCIDEFTNVAGDDEVFLAETVDAMVSGKVRHQWLHV